MALPRISSSTRVTSIRQGPNRSLTPDSVVPSNRSAKNVSLLPSFCRACTRVQALQNDGNRLTFFADRFEGTTLSGVSDLLGPCRIDVTRVDELILGKAIEQSAATLAFHQWTLMPAAEPLANPDGEGEEG